MTVISGNELVGVLEKAGLLPKDVRRVVIDIPCNKPVMIYYECFGDNKAVNLVTEELMKNKDKLEIVPVEEVGS